MVSQLVGRSRAATQLALRLAQAGHFVSMAGPEKSIASARAGGLPVSTLRETPLGGPRVERPHAIADHLPAARRARARQGVRHLEIEPAVALLDEARADLVLIDFELHPLIIVAVGRRAPAGQRVALFTSMLTSPPGLRSPPLHGDIVPGEGLRGSRPGVAAAWAAFWIQRNLERWREHLQRAGSDYPSVLAALARAEGVDLRRETTVWRWQLPFAWRRLPLLILQSRALDFPAPDSEHVRFVGPMLPVPDVTRAEDAALIQSVDAARAGGVRVIYAAFGSIKSPGAKLVERLWAAVATRPDWLLIQVVGRQPATGLPGVQPANVRTVAWAPQRAVLERADAAVVHGGVSTIVEAIVTRTPILTAPYSVTDQRGNAARVVYHGIGQKLDDADSPDRIIDRLDTLMNSRDVAARLARMHDAFATDSERGEAERVVAELLAVDPKTPRSVRRSAVKTLRNTGKRRRAGRANRRPRLSNKRNRVVDAIDRQFPAEAIPAEELACFEERIAQNPGYLDPRRVREAYEAHGLSPLVDPFASDVTELIERALLTGSPYSVVRIGDGEANMLAFETRPGTPTLDRHVFEASVMTKADRFRVSELWMIVVRDLLQGSIHAADIVGVIGAWTPRLESSTTGQFIEWFRDDYRGMAGQWYGRGVMLRYAATGVLRGKVVASAHLYFGVALHIERLLTAAANVLCITSRSRVVADLKSRFPSRRILAIEVGKQQSNDRGVSPQPDFLATTHSALPHDLQGWLCLVGAGPWAEIYCSWIKERGGVAVDIGSGFDLLDGARTRPIHAVLGDRAVGLSR